MRKIQSILLSVILLVFSVPLAAYGASHHHNHHRSHHTVLHARNAQHPSVQFGWASWYGPEMGRRVHGRRTYGRMADGQRFDPNRLTAASRTLPLGSVILVENMQTRESVKVTVTDRGPFVRSRVLDLAEAAAMDIGCRGVCFVMLAKEPVPIATVTELREKP